VLSYDVSLCYTGTHLKNSLTPECLRLKEGSDPTLSERVPGFCVAERLKSLTYYCVCSVFSPSCALPSGVILIFEMGSKYYNFSVKILLF
jgi:hypothetical protein